MSHILYARYDVARKHSEQIMTTTVAVDDVMKSWRVIGNGGHQVDPRLGVG